MHLITNRSLSFRLFVMFFLVLVPIMTIQLAMYRWGTKAVTDELSSAAQSNVVYLRDHLERSLLDLFMQTDLLLNKQAINEFLIYNNSMSPAEYYISARNIISTLAVTQYSNPYVKEILLYYPALQLRISSKNGLDASIDAEYITHRVSTAKSQGKIFVNLDDEFLVCNAKQAYSELSRDALPHIYIEICLDNDAISRHLSSFSNYSNKNAFLINHYTSKMLFSDSFIMNISSIESLSSNTPNQEDKPNNEPAIRHADDKNLYVSCYSPILNCTFTQVIPAGTLLSIPRRFQYFIYAISVLSLLGSLVFILFLRYRIRGPLNALVYGYKQVGEGNFDMKLSEKTMMISEFRHLTIGFNDMIHQLNQLVYKDFEKNLRLQRAELKQLQSQINPHFLYNSFFFLRHMVKNDDSEQAIKLLTHLGDYFKYIGPNANENVHLIKEYQHAMDYLSIQLMRFEGKVVLNADTIPKSLETVLVPRLILQPLFENVFSHCKMHTEQTLMIYLRFERLPHGYFCITISDNGTELSDEKLAELHSKLSVKKSSDATTGLININRRLVLMFGDSCGLKVSRSEFGGLQVQMLVHEGAY